MKEILEAKGHKVHLMDVTRSDTHECVAQAFRYPKIVLMACSYDAGLFPPMERVLMILSHKTSRNVLLEWYRTVPGRLQQLKQ